MLVLVTFTSWTPPNVPVGAASVSTIVPSTSQVKLKGTVPKIVEFTEDKTVPFNKKLTTIRGGLAPLLLTTREPPPLGVKEIWAGPVWETGGVVKFSPRGKKLLVWVKPLGP